VEWAELEELWTIERAPSVWVSSRGGGYENIPPVKGWSGGQQNTGELAPEKTLLLGEEPISDPLSDEGCSSETAKKESLKARPKRPHQARRGLLKNWVISGDGLTRMRRTKGGRGDPRVKGSIKFLCSFLSFSLAFGG